MTNRYLEKIAEMQKEAANPQAVARALEKKHGSVATGVADVADKFFAKHKKSFEIAKTMQDKHGVDAEKVLMADKQVAKANKALAKNMPLGSKGVFNAVAGMKGLLPANG